MHSNLLQFSPLDWTPPRLPFQPTPLSSAESLSVGWCPESTAAGSETPQRAPHSPSGDPASGTVRSGPAHTSYPHPVAFFPIPPPPSIARLTPPPQVPTAPPNTHHGVEPPAPTQQRTTPTTTHTRARHAWLRGHNTRSKGTKERIGGSCCAFQRKD